MVENITLVKVHVTCLFFFIEMHPRMCHEIYFLSSDLNSNIEALITFRRPKSVQKRTCDGAKHHLILN